MKIAALISLSVAVTGLLAGATPASALVKTQPPCGVPCISFGPTGAIPAVRSISFAAPSKGTAIVTFHGALYCLSNNASLTDFSLSTQIVEGNELANPNGPGGTTIYFSLEPAVGGSRTTTINLASTRVFSIAAAGTKVYRFRIARGFVPTGGGCSVYNAVLTVNFTP